jgi:hypothetical protein
MIYGGSVLALIATALEMLQVKALLDTCIAVNF